MGYIIKIFLYFIIGLICFVWGYGSGYNDGYAKGFDKDRDYND